MFACFYFKLSLCVWTIGSLTELCSSRNSIGNLSVGWWLSGSAGGSEGVPAEGDGGQVETDRDQQRHPEPAAVSHAEGES